MPRYLEEPPAHEHVDALTNAMLSNDEGYYFGKVLVGHIDHDDPLPQILQNFIDINMHDNNNPPNEHLPMGDPPFPLHKREDFPNE